MNVNARDGSEAAARLAVVVGRISRRIRLNPGTLSYGKMSALATVVREGPLRPGELARAESVTKPTISRVLDVLEQKGLIERTADPDDGRAFVVMATRSGEQAVAEARSERAGMVAELVDRLSDDEFEDVMRALTALERVSDPGH